MTRLTCRICRDNLHPTPLLVQDDMPASAQGFPSADGLTRDRGVQLQVAQCAGCGVVQLTNPEVDYWRSVIRAAGISPEMQAFRLAQFRHWVDTHHLAGKRVLEVGCGKGEYLGLLAQVGVDAHGMEHANDSVTHCLAKGLSVIQGFPDDPTVGLPGGPYDGFMILNFLEHLPTARDTLRAIRNKLQPSGIGLVEVPNLDMLLADGLFAEFIPDHLYYFTKQTLTRLLESTGFEVLECSAVWHGYVLSAVVRKRPVLSLNALEQRQSQLKQQFHDLIDQHGSQRVAIWGAGHQALALISLMAIGPKIRFVVDSAPFKQGRFTPATHLPIVGPDQLIPSDIDLVLVLAASYSEEVIRIIHERHGDQMAVATLRNGELCLVSDKAGI